MQYQELTERIIGAAFEVYRVLGFGFLESVYGKSLAIELERLGMTVQMEQPPAVHYKDVVVGHFEADMIVDGCVIIELKSLRSLAVAHEVQLVNYRTATGIDVGLLINFGESKVEVKRKSRLLSHLLSSSVL